MSLPNPPRPASYRSVRPSRELNRLLDRACRAVGGKSNFLHLLQISESYYYSWRAKGEVPSARAIEIEVLTAGEIAAPDLCPQLVEASVVKFKLRGWTPSAKKGSIPTIAPDGMPDEGIGFEGEDEAE